MNRQVSDIRTRPSFSNFTGEFPSDRLGEPIKYENLIERDFLLLAEDCRVIETLTNRPDPLIWSYRDIPCTTQFEFGCQLTGGRRALVAVKWATKVRKLRLVELYRAARLSARRDGWRLVMLTERQIRAQPRLANAEMRYFNRRRGPATPVTQQQDLAIFHVIPAGPPVSIGEVRARCNLGRDGYRAIMRLLGEGALQAIDPRVPLDDHALIARTSAL
ncbi:MAG: hypothetical protein KDJ44_10190 [Rhodoblastus sp.]|nr:hypothetical protein [Rhodoblastus sp.]